MTTPDLITKTGSRPLNIYCPSSEEFFKFFTQIIRPRLVSNRNLDVFLAGEFLHHLSY